MRSPRFPPPLRASASRSISQTASAPRPPSHTNIPLFFVENKRLPSNHPFSQSYNGAGMKLSSIQQSASHPSPPPPFGWPNQGIPNEPIFPPNPNQIQPLVPSGYEPTSQPRKPGDRPAPRGHPPRGAKGALWGGAPSGPRSVPKLAHSRRWLVSSRKLPPEPCNLLSSAGKKNFTGWH